MSNFGHCSLISAACAAWNVSVLPGRSFLLLPVLSLDSYLLPMLTLDNVCSTAACAAFGRVCPTAAYAVCGRVCPTAAFTASGRICAKADFAAWMCLQYSIAALCMLPFGLVWTADMCCPWTCQFYNRLRCPIDVSVIQQSVMSLDVSVNLFCSSLYSVLFPEVSNLQQLVFHPDVLYLFKSRQCCARKYTYFLQLLVMLLDWLVQERARLVRKNDFLAWQASAQKIFNVLS